MIRQDCLPTDTDVQFFEENGYWLGGKVIDDDQLAALHTAMDDVFAGRFETERSPYGGGWRDRGIPGEIRKSDNAHWSNDTIRALALNPTIGAIAARLMKTPEVRLWHDQLLYKPGQAEQNAAPQAAGNVGWHQDYGYWQCTSDDLITAWVALVDVDIKNGCMQVVPGSHQWGLLPESDFFNTDLNAMRAAIEAHTGRPFSTKACTLRAGEVSFHHCLTIHGSGPNVTAHPRRSLAIHLMPAHASYRADSPNDNHMNALFMKERGGNDGDLFTGDQWPVVYRTA